jgi:hypothetical protein
MGNRKKIPRQVETELLFQSDMKCCICQRRGDHIHHIDRDSSNNEPYNLAVLCFDHHSEIETKGGLRKKYSADIVRKYRDHHHESLKAKRENEKQVFNSNLDELTKDRLVNAALTAHLLVRIHELQDNYYNAKNREKAGDVLNRFFAYSTLATGRVTYELFGFLESVSHTTRGGMPKTTAYTMLSLVYSYFGYQYSGEEQTMLGKQCCEIGYSMAYDGYVKLDDFEIALHGLSILKVVHGRAICSKNTDLENEAIDRFMRLQGDLIRPERPELLDAHKFVSFMKDEWLKEVGNLTLPVYPIEIQRIETANHQRLAARKTRLDV